ncbi:MAG: YaiI/YqxD family protein [Nitrospinota bacterium]|nr:YaiI/YqxD family protein [Nitrospinota bacterium]MDH5756574.1 YaiI/YqxD family protein [Nitrospinota bacterium]
MIIWIDADAAPRAIKEMVYKAAKRTNLPVRLVANSYMSIPDNPLFTITVVESGPDEADRYIEENIAKGHIVITADIPLAAKVVARGAHAINPVGVEYTEKNVGERLAARNLMSDLRSAGMDTGGPSALSRKNVQDFANILDRLLTRLMKRE